MYVKTLDHAIKIINQNKLGNNCSIFTESVANSQKCQNEVNIEQVGVNTLGTYTFPMLEFSKLNKN